MYRSIKGTPGENHCRKYTRAVRACATQTWRISCFYGDQRTALLKVILRAKRVNS